MQKYKLIERNTGCTCTILPYITITQPDNYNINLGRERERQRDRQSDRERDRGLNKEILPFHP